MPTTHEYHIPDWRDGGKPWKYRASLTPRKTYSADSKIVYKRKRHPFTLRDAERIMSKIPKDEVDEGFTWWQRILNWLAEYMLSKITGVLSLDEGVGQIAWYAVNYFWDTIVKRIGGGNSFIDGSIDAYKAAFKRALNAYLAGDSTLLDKLYRDLINL